jgi:K+-transporting ATPase KdpF subunit
MLSPPAGRVKTLLAFYTFFTPPSPIFTLEQPSRRLTVALLTGLTAIVVAALFLYLVFAMFRAEDL